MGHIARNCPHAKDQVKKGKNKRCHAQVAEDDEPVQKKAREDDTSEEEYVLTSALTETLMEVAQLVYKHITKKDSPHKI